MGRFRYFTALTGANETINLPQNLLSSNGSLMEDFEDATEWGEDEGLIDNTTEFLTGTQSLKIQPVLDGGNLTALKNVTLDMSNMTNIRISVFCHTESSSNFSPPTLRFYTSAGVFYTYSLPACYWGWNTFDIAKTDFTPNGSPDWATITQIYLRLVLVAGFPEGGSVDSLIQNPIAQTGAVGFVFDDNGIDIYDIAYPILKAHKIRGTSYVIGNAMDATKSAHCQEMYADGWTIGNHTETHASLTTLTVEQIETELTACKNRLDALSIATGDHVAYPGGNVDPDVMTAMANLGMKTGRTVASNNMLVFPYPDAYRIGLGQTAIVNTTTLASVIARIDACIAAKKVILLLIHGLAATEPPANSWYTDRFQSVAEYVTAKGVPCLTMDDIYQLQSGSISIPRSV